MKLQTLPSSRRKALFFFVHFLSVALIGVAEMSATGDAGKDSDYESEMIDEKCLECTLIIANKAGYPTAEIKIKNISEKLILIEYQSHPLEYLDLAVFNVCGKKVSSFYYGGIFSPLGKEEQLALKSKGEYKHSVDLFGTTNKEDKPPGQYLIQAIYTYKGIQYKSKTVKVELKSGM